MTYNPDNMLSILRTEINLFSVMDEKFLCAVKLITLVHLLIKDLFHASKWMKACKVMWKNGISHAIKMSIARAGKVDKPDSTIQPLPMCLRALKVIILTKSIYDWDKDIFSDFE